MVDDERDEAALGPGRRVLRQLRLLALLAVAVVAVGFAGGWLFGESRGPAAARQLLAGRVTFEPAGGPAGDPVAPTSGPPGGDPRCGLHDDPLRVEDQIAVLRLGGAVIQYRPADVGSDDLAALEEVVAASASHVAAAPNPKLGSPVVATAFERRLRLEDVDVSLLRAFVVGYVVPSGAPSDCPTG